LPNPGDTICGEILLERLAPSSIGAEAIQPVFVASHLGRNESLWLAVVDGMLTPTSVELSAFMAGANALMSVRHPSLVRVVLVDREEDYCVVGYEQLPGAEPIFDLVERGEGREVLARAAVEVARGLACLHSRGFLHGALTPGTVLLWEGAPVLWEHGLAAFCDPVVLGPRSRSLGGDAVAPEVPTGAPLTPATDVYAWGAVMAAIVSGELGSEAVAAVLDGDVDPGPHGLLLGVVRTALAPEPGRRPRDGVHLLELLQRALATVDPNTELAPAERAHEGGDDVLRELASRYLAEMAEVEKAGGKAARPPAAPSAPETVGGAIGRVAVVKRAPEGSGPRSQATAPSLVPEPGRAPSGFQPTRPGGGALGIPAGNFITSPAEAVARWTSHSPEASASAWLRPGTPRAADGGKDGLFDPKKPYLELEHGIRKRSLLSAAAAAAPRPVDRPPPRRGDLKQQLDEEETPREGIRIADDRGGELRDELRGLDDLELIMGNVPQSERVTPSDVPIVTPLAGRSAQKPKRESRKERKARLERERARGSSPEPELEPDLPDILEEHELPPMPEDDEPLPEGEAAAKKPARSAAREGYRVPRTPGPHGPPAGLMAGGLLVLCGVMAVAVTLAASSAKGGFGRMLGGEPSVDAVVEDGAAAGADGAGEGDEAVADAGPCPKGMIEIQAKPSPSFCIDRAEQPGIDQPPTVDIDLARAQEACAAKGHSLCEPAQWDRACRGAAGWTHPYGPRWEAGRCRVGDENAAPGPSGADPHCVTPEGVVDLVGNVAEWTADGSVMGGSVRSAKDSGCDTKQRQKPKVKNPVVGFRCCMLLPATADAAGGG